MQNNESNMKYDNLIFDVNNYYHKAHHVYKDYSQDIGNKRIMTGGVYGFIKMLRKYEREYLKENGHIYFLFDNPDSKKDTRQLSIDPNYKANRKKYSQPFYRGLDYLRLLLMNNSDNSTIIYGTGFEADDLAPNVINKIDKNESTLILSEDLDWARLIDFQGKTIHLYMNKKVFDKKTFNNKYNFIPTQENIILYKVIKGDTADNIPIGIPGIRTEKVERLIGDYNDIFEIIENINMIDYLNDKWKKKIIERKARLRLNHQLVSFIPISDSYLKQFTFKSKFRPKSLIFLYESLKFNPIELDKRLEQYYNNEERNVDKEKNLRDSFFKMPKARRG